MLEKDYGEIDAAKKFIEVIENSFATGMQFRAARVPTPENQAELAKFWYRKAGEAVEAGVDAYLGILSITNEGLDWVITVDEIAKGNYWAAVGFLPVVTGGTIKVVDKAGEVVRVAPNSTVERGWLQFWEERGIGNSRGHVIAQHVGKSDADLIARIGSNKKISAASSFTDQATAEAVIGGAIRQNRTQLSAWLRTAQQGDRLPLTYPGTDVIGRGIKKGQSVVGDRTSAKIILQALGNGKYHILTAFPQ